MSDSECSPSTVQRYVQHADWLSVGSSSAFRIDELQHELVEHQRQRAAKPRHLSQEFVATLNTGRTLDPEKWRERIQRDERLAAQTEAIASILEHHGVVTAGDNSVVAISLATGQVERLDQYRSIRFLPLIAQRDRRPVLQELRYLVQISWLLTWYRRMEDGKY